MLKSVDVTAVVIRVEGLFVDEASQRDNEQDSRM